MCGIHTKSLTKDKSYPIHCFSDIKIGPTECICCQYQYKLANHVDLLNVSHNSCGKKMGQQATSLNRKIGSVIPFVIYSCYWLLCFTCQQRFYFITERACNLFVKVQRSRYKLGDAIMRGYY